MKKKRILRVVALSLAWALVLSFGLLQLVPWSIEANPPVSRAPDWDSEATAALARRAGCMDCHSNETTWPWYASVAPVGWLVVDHVREGRTKLNLSELDQPQRDAHEAGEVLREGEMPPSYYALLYPGARLTAAERESLATGLEQTLEGVPRASEGEGR